MIRLDYRMPLTTSPDTRKCRCPDCGGLFPESGFYWTKGVRDCYCKGCRKRRVRESTSPAQRKAAKDRYVAKHGREKINADERRRKNHLPIDVPGSVSVPGRMPWSGT